MTAEEKVTEVINRMNAICRDNCAAYTESMIHDAMIEIFEWTIQEIAKEGVTITINRDFLYNIKQYIHEKYLDYHVGEKINLIMIKPLN